MTTPDRLANQAAMAEPLSELELLKRELHLMKTAGIIEVAVRNPSVAEYMEHWEGRALKAESTPTPVPGVSEAMVTRADMAWCQATQELKSHEECLRAALEAAVQSPPAGTAQCDGQLCYYHGCQRLPGCVQDNALAAPVEAVATEPVASLKLQHVRGHKHTCANVQIDSTIDDKCDCGALDTAGNAIPICSPSGDSGALREALAALEPFEAIANDAGLSDHPDDYAPRPSKGRPNMGDFRAARKARAALAGEKAP